MEEAARIIPAADYWQTWGVLGIAAGCALLAFLYWFFRVYLPDLQERQRIARVKAERENVLELTSKEKAIALSDTLREVLPAFADTQKRLVTQIEVMHDRQEPHAEACKKTVEKVEKLSERVEQIAGCLKLGNT